LETSLSKRVSVIQRALLKYGYSSFKLEIAEYCEKSNTIIREQCYIDNIKPELNILNKAGSSLGYKHTPEAIEKMIAFGKTRTFSEETREKIRKDTLSRIDNIRLSVALANGHSVIVADIESGEINEYHSINEAARKLNVNEKTVRNYIKSGKILKDKFQIVKK